MPNTMLPHAASRSCTIVVVICSATSCDGAVTSTTVAAASGMSVLISRLGVQRLDLLAVCLLHHAPFHLQRRRDLAAVDAELARQHQHLLRPLVARELAQSRFDFLFQLRSHTRIAHQCITIAR